jgi:hypothetical protein
MGIPGSITIPMINSDVETKTTIEIIPLRIPILMTVIIPPLNSINGTSGSGQNPVVIHAAEINGPMCLAKILRDCLLTVVW